MDPRNPFPNNNPLSGIRRADVDGRAPSQINDESDHRLFAAGEVIDGKYKIMSVLGEGGMGTVYKVEQIFLRKPFALKTLLPQKMTDKALLRFQKEARAAGGLDHKGLVKVHDFGVIGNDQPFLVMDFVEGDSLSARIERSGPLTLDALLPIFTDLAYALAYCHEHGVIHRDLKPGNVMITSGDAWSQPQVKLVDFGIAKVVGSEADNFSLTQTGEMIGSPYYMSPEQCLGIQVDHRSDIYSFGVMMFEALTGTPPFLADSVIGTMMRHQTEEAPSLKEATLGKDFPDDVEKVVAKLLQKSPDARYKNMMEVVQALQQLKSGARISETPRTKGIARAENNRFQIIQATMAVLFVVGVAVVSYYLGRASVKIDPSQFRVIEAIPADHKPLSEIEAEHRQQQPVVAIPKFYSHLDRKNPTTRIFEFPDQDRIGSIKLHGNAVFRINDQPSHESIMTACGYRVIDHFEPFSLIMDVLAVNHLQVLKGFKPDEVRSIQFNRLSDCTNETIAQLCKLVPKVSELSLREVDGTDDCIKSLNTLPNLVELDISDSGITGRGLANLRRLPELERLAANRTKYVSAFLPKLNGSRKLRWLAVGRCLLCDEDVKQIGTLQNVRELDLGGNIRITDAGVASLTNLKLLRSLDLSRCNLSAGCIQYIKTLPLVHLYINTEKWTDAEKAALHKALPGTRIDAEMSHI